MGRGWELDGEWWGVVGSAVRCAWRFLAVSLHALAAGTNPIDLI